MTSPMTSRNRLIAVAVLLVCAIAAAGAYALSAHRDPADAGATPSPQAASTAPAATSGAAAAGPTAAGPTAAAWVPADPRIADVCRSKLPTPARSTLALIAAGGPYPYRSDGIVFENRESRLPRQRTGYYHEYTVVTPGSQDRGTRRVVTGAVGEQYWTADHYASFQEIDPRC
ncbi:ribonuclease [Kitasatospora sp. NBC_00240]|uniref:ribonuclease domain-containing protein n=1 Tax=Kitasatospora sp. NBC_00240 TaxID=2903567 RepID=UPI00224C9AF7|nr:ribonuclease domain-containing protein [Kitasatospora sp. NBC_00240]MCX5213069.1 ribonuclease [Kitasatospora sp. NBC_00240]